MLIYCKKCESANRETADRCETCDEILKPDARPARRKYKGNFLKNPVKRRMSTFASVFWGVTLSSIVLSVIGYAVYRVDLYFATQRLQAALEGLAKALGD